MKALLHDRYEKRITLGTGGFSTIYLALDRVTGQEVCVKEFTAAHMDGVATSLQSHGYTIALTQEKIRLGENNSVGPVPASHETQRQAAQSRGRKEPEVAPASPSDAPAKDRHPSLYGASPSDADKLARGLAQIRREAQMLQLLSDIPGVPALIETFEEAHTYYLVKEYLEGMTLSEYEDRFRGSMPYPLALFIMRGVLEILRQVHDRGYLHCDVSPINIFLCRDGSVHLIDWGNTVDRNGSMADELVRQAVNVRYAAPEQHISGATLDPRTDLYCLSASIYEALCGEPPAAAIERLRGEQLIPVQFQAKDLPTFATALLEQGLEIEMEDRCSSAEEMLDALDEEIRFSVTPVATGGASVSARLVHEKRSPMGFLTSRRLRRPALFLE